MGLWPSFVFSVNRRGALAVLAIAVSVGYALVAGAATGGLKDAQTALASGLDEGVGLVVDPHLGPFDASGLSPAPDGLLARHTANDTLLVAALAGPGGPANASHAYPGPSAGFAWGERFNVSGSSLLLVREPLPPGAPPDAILVHPDVLAALGGPRDASAAWVAVYDDAEAARAAAGRDLAVVESPGAFPFYRLGAEDLVTTIALTVAASSLVVGLVTSAFVRLELEARRRSFATLHVYAGPRLVQRIVAARGVAMLLAGHAIGLGVTLVLIVVLSRAGAASLGLPPWYLAIALTGTLGGGLVGLAVPVAQAGRALHVQRLQLRVPPPWLPSALNTTLVSWRSLVPLAASAAVLAASLGVVYGAADIPSQIFSADGSEVLASTANNPLRGTVPLFLGLHLGDADGYEASSPEIFAPTVLGGRAVLVRGVSWEGLERLEGDDLVLDGVPPLERGQAVAGHRLAASLGLAIGDAVLVPSAYGASTERVEVVGVVRGLGLLGDELLVPLETARALTGIPADKVNLVRFRYDPAALENLTGEAPLPGGVVVTRLLVAPLLPVPHEEATATVRVINFDPIERARHLTLRVNGEPVADAWVTLGPQEATSVRLPFRVPPTGVVRLEVNPTRNVATGEAAYRFEAPAVTPLGEPLDVRVLEDGAPASGVTVRLLEAEATTGADGRAHLVPAALGNHSLEAAGAAGRGARPILVVEPSDLHRGRLVVESLSGPPSITRGPWEGAAVVTNVGGALFDGTLTLPVDGETQNASAVRLVPGERARVPVSLAVGQGTHEIGPEGARLVVTVAAPPREGAPGSDPPPSPPPSGTPGSGGPGRGEGGTPDGGPMVEELLVLRRELARERGVLDVDPTQAFLGDTFENLNAAVTLVTLATVLHAGLVTTAAVQRDLEERAPTVGTLAAIGAARGSLRARAAREYLLVGGAAAVLGTALGLGAVQLGAEQGLLVGFGHALVPRTSTGFGLRVAAVALATTLAAAALAVDGVRNRHLGELLAEGPARARRPPLEALLEERT